MKQTDDNQWGHYQNVKINKVTCKEDKLLWEFLDVKDKPLSINPDDIISIKIEEFAEYCEECSFKDPYFVKMVKYLL